MLLVGASLLTNARGYVQPKLNDWRSLAAYLQAHAQPQDIVVSPLVWAKSALHWYLDPAARYPVFNSADPDIAPLLSGTRRIWLIQPIEEPLDASDPKNPLASLDLRPDDGWMDPALDYGENFFPISEPPARLYVGEKADSWIQFGTVPQPNWTDRAYSDIAPGAELRFSLTLAHHAPRELVLTYFDNLQKELEISVNGQTLGVVGGVGGDWQTVALALPAGLGDTVDVTLKAVGGGIAGVSFAELRAATP